MCFGVISKVLCYIIAWDKPWALSEPHTNETTCVWACSLACLDRPLTVYPKLNSCEQTGCNIMNKNTFDNACYGC